MFLQILISFLPLFVLTTSKSIPSYIKPCRISDPNFEQCAIRNGNEAIPYIIKGDKSFKAGSLSPLILPEVILTTSSDLIIKLTDVHVDFQGTKLLRVNLDRENKRFSVKAGKDLFYITSDYDVNGRILLLPISGSGPCNMTLEGLEVEYVINYDFVKKDGEEYLNILSDSLDYSADRAIYFFDNLFNGNQQLGEETNKVLNESWKEFNKELKPAINEVIKTIVRRVANNYITSIPYNEMFLN